MNKVLLRVIVAVAIGGLLYLLGSKLTSCAEDMKKEDRDRRKASEEFNYRQ